jgi:hypothetical protein
MVNHSLDNLARAILQTVAYSDIFDYPLRAPEIHRYLTGVPASVEAVNHALEDAGLLLRVGEYFVLPGREEIVGIRLQREARSRKLLPRAIRYGRILGAMPYIRMVALTGSLAVSNVSDLLDFDYMLVTAPGRLWTARAFALAFNRLTRLQGYTLCPNLIISEAALEWPSHDLYSARELCQMIPITGLDVYSRLLNANKWVQLFLPNCRHDFREASQGGSRGQRATEPEEELRTPALAGGAREVATNFRSIIELPLRGRLGERLEAWEMNRKIARFSRQHGFGEETVFNAAMCQGNFDHHGSWTRQALQKRLAEIELKSPLLVGER